jgi:hypothetical protein
MKPLPRPEIPVPTPEQTAKDNEAKQLRMSYGMLFGSEHGKRVLEDLKRRYGFSPDGTELPIYSPGLDAMTTTHRDGMREPVRHILRMTALIEKPADKPTVATS